MPMGLAKQAADAGEGWEDAGMRRHAAARVCGWVGFGRFRYIPRKPGCDGPMEGTTFGARGYGVVRMGGGLKRVTGDAGMIFRVRAGAAGLMVLALALGG